MEVENRGPSHGRPALLVLFAALALVIWAQKRALLAFFSSPDDMVHLQQAVGLKPLVSSPFRFLSQVLYFKVMVGIFGPWPIAFHLLSLAVHLLNVALLHRLFMHVGASSMVAGLSASLFGCFPLFFPLMASAVGMNDELALTFTLAMLMAVAKGGRWSSFLASLAFVVGLLCKESILAMPLVAAAVAKPESRRAQVIPLLVIAAVFAVLLLLRPPQGLEPYRVEFGANVFHNAMTYAAWAINLSKPMPDMVSSFDPRAWKIGIWVYSVGLASWFLMKPSRSLVRVGLAWWAAGLLPVLALKFQTFRHYLYPALPGPALVAALLAAWLVGRAWRVSSTVVPTRAVAATLALCAILYSARADHMIKTRIEARVPGTRLALDPLVRRQEVAANAIGSLAQQIPGEGPVDLLILEPEGTGRVFGARSGREYGAPVHARYDLLKESLDGGGAVRVFLPPVRRVDFAARWSSRFSGHDLFLPYMEGALVGFGKSPGGYARAVDWMVQQRMVPQARVLIDSLLVVYPDSPELIRRGLSLRSMAED